MIRRLVFYLMVGASGILVNLVVLTAVHRLLPHWPNPITYLFAVEASIISNYLLNARFTFHNPLSWRGAGQFNLVSAAGALIQTAIYTFLMRHFGWHYRIADLVAIPFGTGFGFLFSSIWVFRKRGESHEPDRKPGAEPQPQGTEGHS
ncbi:GtrA family protein [Sulfobacillus harzensis]|uniref:GtrA family protein n=1 Tax=Sulfobacillus harzensis TaxID=2729629 RepID=A0A7Y0L0I5_9FIRM|nr:GtrA family protein [Sulfobacillus harzensis]NMP21042.1 GtrA family protein [Sulfobacillus harzensis]